MTADKKLDCPKCLGLLQPIEVGEMEKKSVYIDQCAICQGVWFDKGELEKILSLKLGFNDEVMEADFRKDLVGDYLDLKRAKCPRCKKEMQRVKSLQDSRLITDYCLDCGGVWLDGGEMRLLMRGGPIERALRFIFNKISEPLQRQRSEK